MQTSSTESTTVLRQAVENAFRGMARPSGVDALPFLGCCQEHTASFEVYRTMTLAEFEAALRTTPEQFDPFEYTSLVPELVHYFAPALLGAAIASVEAPWKIRSTIGDFVRAHVPLDEKHATAMRSKLLPLFDDAQRAVMRRFFEWFFPAYDQELTPAEWTRLMATWN